MLYLHHLTPMNEAAQRVAPAVPVIGHIHGSELLMLERIAAGVPAGWTHAETLGPAHLRLGRGLHRIIVNSPKGLKRASALLDLHPDRFALVPNGFGRGFAPRRDQPPRRTGTATWSMSPWAGGPADSLATSATGTRTWRHSRGRRCSRSAGSQR